MERTIHEKRMLLLLKSALNEKKIDEAEAQIFESMTDEDWSELFKLASVHKTIALVHEGLGKNKEIIVPAGLVQRFRQESFRSSLGLYRKAAICSKILKMAETRGASFAILKGISLSRLYPVPESRSFGDIDLFVSDKNDYEMIISVFEESGFEKEAQDMTDYHTCYTYVEEDVNCDVEVHYSLTGHFYNGEFDIILNRIYLDALAAEPYETFRFMNQEYKALPVTVQALHLLMHMFQHFMATGFGIRLFCDWTVFWNTKHKEVDVEQFKCYVHNLNLEKFLDIITMICGKYLGLSDDYYGFLNDSFSENELAEVFLQDVFEGGDFGKLDKNRMLITSRKTSIWSYFLEMHRQMKRNYPRLKNIWILWPFLWASTVIRFLINNVTERKISARDIFESAKKRNKLAQQFHVFDLKRDGK